MRVHAFVHSGGPSCLNLAVALPAAERVTAEVEPAKRLFPVHVVPCDRTARQAQSWCKGAIKRVKRARCGGEHAWLEYTQLVRSEAGNNHGARGKRARWGGEHAWLDRTQLVQQ